MTFQHLLLAFLVGVGSGFNWKEFFPHSTNNGPTFPDSQLYLLQGDWSLGLSGIDGYISALGDFNSDKLYGRN
jgi:hypothetical protein